MDRFIEIKKENVIYNVESIVRKAISTRNVDGTLAYHIQPDTDNRLDVELLHRSLEKRDADIRRFLAPYLKSCCGFLDNDLRNEDDDIIYALSLADNWKTSLFRTLEVYIHDYLVKGIVYDYLIDKIPETAQPYEKELEKLEGDIKYAAGARDGGVVKRPLQPF